MSVNTQSKIEKSSHIRQIGGATLAMTLGLGFAYASANLFWSNQRNYVRNFKKFRTARQTCRIVSQPSPTNENKLIYVSDEIIPNDIVSDDTLNIDIQSQDQNKKIIYMYRECQMFQWKENYKSTTNKYCAVWSSLHIDSGEFQDIENYKNPAMKIKSKLFHTKQFNVSNFTFDLNGNESITQPKTPIHELLNHAKLAMNCNISLDDVKCQIKEDHSKDGWYYFSFNDNQIGDIRVRLWIISQPLSLTVIGTQIDDKIDNGGDVCMRSIGKYEHHKAFRKYFNVKLFSHDTGAIFAMMNIALCLGIYSSELLKPLIFEKNQLKQDLEATNCKPNDLGLRALIGSSVICVPSYCLGVMYPYFETHYEKHETLMKSIGFLTIASIVLGSSQRLFQSQLKHNQ